MRLKIYLRDGTAITIHPSSIDSVYVNDRPLVELLDTDEVEKIEVEVE